MSEITVRASKTIIYRDDTKTVDEGISIYREDLYKMSLSLEEAKALSENLSLAIMQLESYGNG